MNTRRTPGGVAICHVSVPLDATLKISQVELTCWEGSQSGPPGIQSGQCLFRVISHSSLALQSRSL